VRRARRRLTSQAAYAYGVQVGDGEIVTVGATRLRVHSTPFHTLHHVVFVVLRGVENSGGQKEQRAQKQLLVEQEEQEAVFSGDVLLPGGCGRLFRGTAATACALLNEGLLATLPPTALLFPGCAPWLVPHHSVLAACSNGPVRCEAHPGTSTRCQTFGSPAGCCQATRRTRSGWQRRRR
jgi:glyoxylase-like metal-dependent hydrolase (beta-lactamase superfamily II)